MTNKNTLILVAIGAIIVIGVFALGSGNKDNSSTLASNTSNSSSVSTPAQSQVSVIPADKIEVVHFHGTQQCYSCITVGEYALQTIKDKFPEEYASGKIVFRDINGELKENQEIVMKHQARGSSLFINAIRDDKDNISEDVTVWRLVNNGSQFVSYFEGKLNTLLGK